jgi:acyl carrier protein
METTDLEAHVRQVLTDRLGIAPDALTRDSRLVEDLGLDSLDTLELAMTLEEELGVQVSRKQVGEVRTLEDLLALVQPLTDDRDRLALPERLPRAAG